MSLKAKRVDVSETQTIQDILDSAPQYSLNVDGVERVEDGAKLLFEELPQNTTYARKHVLLIEKDSIPIGVADLIEDYPSKEIVFLGLLLIKEGHQGKGVGKSSYKLIEDYSRELGAKKIRLAVVKCNPVEGYWEKMGFKRTGIEKPHQGKNLKSTVFVMEKLIS